MIEDAEESSLLIGLSQELEQLSCMPLYPSPIIVLRSNLSKRRWLQDELVMGASARISV